MINDVQSILRVCGLGKYLQVGCGTQPLVFELLKRSVDAYGIDSSAEIIAKHNERAPDRFFQSSLTHFTLPEKSFDTVIIGSELLNFDVNQLPAVMNALTRITTRHLVLYFTPENLQALTFKNNEAHRLFWEKLAILGNFRRHPREMLAKSYEAHEDERISSLTFFELVPEASLQRFPLKWLLENRDLHMDMLREAGRRSDGHVSRYVLAAEKIRQGDVVLDAACGLGYGTAVLAACSNGARFIGVDIDPESIAYAEANFTATNPAISYQASDVTRIAFLPDHSVDVVVSFETIEHVKDYDAFLSEVKRVLKPDGRFIGSVPHMWCDETGNDPNPYHFHVFDWDKLNQAIGKYFIVDHRWAQTAGGGFKLRNGQRVMQPIPLNIKGNIETEWWIISACANPQQATNIPYTNPFQRHTQTINPIIDFGSFYNNAWLYRVMVQLGERLEDRDVLVEFCVNAANAANKGAADRGAALCVIGYQLLEMGHSHINEIAAFNHAVKTYHEAYDQQNIHAHRWAISLHFIQGRLLLTLGDQEAALASFLACANLDPLRFSPLLATKTISARMYAALLLVNKQDIVGARQLLQSAIKEAHRAMQGDWKNIVGSLDHPLPFGLQEAAEVLEIASQCAQALHALDKEKSVPGYFWDKINLKRFGLVEWNKSLENENRSLRQSILQRQNEQMSEKAIA